MTTAVPMSCQACAKQIAPYDGHFMVMRYRVGDSGVDHFCSGACVRAYTAPEQRRESARPDAYSEGLLRVAVAAREYLSKSEDTDAMEEDDDARADAHEAWWALRTALDALDSAKEGT